MGAACGQEAAPAVVKERRKSVDSADALAGGQHDPVPARSRTPETEKSTSNGQAEKVIVAYDAPEVVPVTIYTRPVKPNEKALDKLKQRNGPSFMTRLAMGQTEPRHGAPANSILATTEMMEDLDDDDDADEKGSKLKAALKAKRSKHQTGMWQTTMMQADEEEDVGTFQFGQDNLDDLPNGFEEGFNFATDNEVTLQLN